MAEETTMLPCPWCAQPITAQANFCSRCGKAVNQMTGTLPVTATPKWYYNIWFVLFMLFFVLGPLGLPLVWKNPKLSKGVKIALTLVMAVYTLLLIELIAKTVQAVMGEVRQFNSTFQF